MSQLRKIFSCLMMLILVIGTLNCTAASETMQRANAHKEIFVLKSLGVIDDSFDAESSYLTRSQMAMLAVRLLGVRDEGVYSGGFSDVTADTEYAGYISHAKALGIMNGNGESFMPQRFVSGQEAAKTLVSALGYDVVAIQKGGWSTGYVACASELGLLKNVSSFSDAVISSEDAYIMFANALDVKPMNPTYGTEAGYEKDSLTLGEILEDRFELEYVEGTVVAVDETTLDDSADFEEGYVVIGNRKLAYSQKELLPYLAFPVYAYADSKGKLVEICKNEELYEETVISPADIENLSLSEITFFGKDGKDEKIKISDDAAFIYNGKPLTTPLKDDLIIHSGKLRLVSNDDDKACEAVFIEETVSVCVDTIYEPNNSVYFKAGFSFGGRSSISFDFENDDLSFKIINADGNLGSFSDIKEGMALTVMQSRDAKVTTVYLSAKTVSGVLEEMNAARAKVTIDKVSYDLAVNEAGTPWLDAPLGTNAEFLVDADGRIVCLANDASDDKFAFVSAMSTPGGMAQPKVLLRTSGKSVREEKESGNSIIVSYKYQNGEDLEMEFASKVRFNGTSVAPSDISKNALCDKLIKYKLDSDGKLKSIDTYDSYNERASMNFNAEIISFGGKADRDSFLVGSSTKVLCVPNVPDSNGDWNQTVKCTDEGSYTVYGADIDPESNIAGAVVIYADMDADALVPIDEDTKISIVVSSSEVMDDDGDAVCSVHILTENEENYIMTGSNLAAKEAAKSLRPGDLIRYSTDVDGRIANLELLASIQDLDRFYRANANSTNEEIYGRVTNVEVNRLSRIKNEFVDKVTIATNEWLSNGVSYELVQKDGPVMYICNPSKKTVRAASGYDMLGSQQFGVAESSKVFMLVKNNDPQAVVVIE